MPSDTLTTTDTVDLPFKKLFTFSGRQVLVCFSKTYPGRGITVWKTGFLLISRFYKDHELLYKQQIRGITLITDNHRIKAGFFSRRQIFKKSME